MPLTRRRSAGFTLIELLAVILLIGIMAGMVIPSATPSIYEQLQSAARIVSADIAYGRNLAVSHDSRYAIKFGPSAYQYLIAHTGTNPTLDALPPSPFRSPSDPPDQHIVRLDEIPNMGMPVQIVAVLAMADPVQKVTRVEFGPLGETTRAEQTVIWLGAGSGTGRRYLSISINPVTGLAQIGPFQAIGPPSG